LSSLENQIVAGIVKGSSLEGIIQLVSSGLINDQNLFVCIGILKSQEMSIGGVGEIIVKIDCTSESEF